MCSARNGRCRGIRRKKFIQSGYADDMSRANFLRPLDAGQAVLSRPASGIGRSRVFVQVSTARRAKREADAGQRRVDAGSRRLVFGGRGRPLAAARRSPPEIVEKVLTGTSTCLSADEDENTNRNSWHHGSG